MARYVEGHGMRLAREDVEGYGVALRARRLAYATGLSRALGLVQVPPF